MKGKNNNILFSFFRLGCIWEYLCQHNILYYDFHEDNFLFSKDGDFSVADMDDVEIVKFPEEIEKYANGLSNLYVNFGMELGAAFRYGFINAAGEIGNVLYDIMYNRNGMSALSITTVRKIDTNAETLSKIYSEWHSLVDDSFVKKITNKTYEYGEFSFIELMERNRNDYNEFKEKYKDNRDLLKHEYQVYFANGLTSENDFDIAASALTLCQIEFCNQQFFLAGYYYMVACERIVRNEAGLMSLKKDILYARYLFVSKFGQEETQRVYDYIFHETFRLRIQRSTENYFYEIWYWSDFSKDFLIEDYIKERSYGCYKCDDCNNIDFFDELIEKCGICGSKRIEKISLQEYINLKTNILTSEDTSASKKSFVDDTQNIEIHELKSVELIPIYVQMLNTYAKKGEYDAAIELGKQVEAFLQSNPNVYDEKGYVIEKAKAGGQIFCSTTTPNEVLKLFLEGTENVKNDYESYIYYKLCVLYDKKNNCTVALEYAEKLIKLANCSPRWLQQRYVECAYLLMKTYYEDKGDKKEALIYSNILFTYDMLDKIDHELSQNINCNEIRDTITSLMNIGNSNAKAGNISLAYSCYILALRMHIYHHGCRHPETALIYSNIAKLLATKKIYDEAYSFWGVSLMLLESSKIERYKEQISEIEMDISKCLSEADYYGSISKWKEEYMTEQTFNIFPEKRFENRESPDNKMPSIEISREELFKEYVVYNK